MNTVNLMGNLARDPEVRYTKTGRAVATFTVAASNTYIDANTKEAKEQTAFVNCVAWGTLAAMELGRSAYGFEISKDFYSKAKSEMLSDVKTQTSLLEYCE